MEKIPIDIISTICKKMNIIDIIPFMLSSKYLFNINRGKLGKFRLKKYLTKSSVFTPYVINDNVKMLEWYRGSGIEIKWNKYILIAIKNNSNKN